SSLSLDEVELGRERYVVRESRLTRGERVVPVEPEARAVDLALELQPDALAAVRIRDRVGDRAVELDRLLDATDRQLAPDSDVVAVADDLVCTERELRRPLRVEE